MPQMIFFGKCANSIVLKRQHRRKGKEEGFPPRLSLKDNRSISQHNCLVKTPAQFLFCFSNVDFIQHESFLSSLDIREPTFKRVLKASSLFVLCFALFYLAFISRCYVSSGLPLALLALSRNQTVFIVRFSLCSSCTLSLYQHYYINLVYSISIRFTVKRICCFSWPIFRCPVLYQNIPWTL